MTIPKFTQEVREKLSDYVRNLFPVVRTRMSKEEVDLGIHLRGNPKLYEALTAIIKTRIEGRAGIPEPSDPLDCKSMLARDRELQWLLSRLAFVYSSPVNQQEDGELPA
jgi:hypothetical protein